MHYKKFGYYNYNFKSSIISCTQNSKKLFIFIMIENLLNKVYMKNNFRVNHLIYIYGSIGEHILFLINVVKFFLELVNIQMYSNFYYFYKTIVSFLKEATIT